MIPAIVITHIEHGDVSSGKKFKGFGYLVLMVELGASRLPKSFKPGWINEIRNQGSVYIVAVFIRLACITDFVSVKADFQTDLQQSTEIDIRIT